MTARKVCLVFLKKVRVFSLINAAKFYQTSLETCFEAVVVSLLKNTIVIA